MADIVTDLSINKNWNVAVGFNNTFTFTFTQSAVAFNITGYTFSLQIRRFGASTDTVNLIQGTGLTNGGSNGILTCVLNAANSALLQDGEYFWQLTAVHPDTFSYRWFNGTLRALEEIYSGDTASGISVAISLNGTSITAEISLPGSNDTFTNGLTKTGTVVKLGGTPLTEDTTIEGAGLYSLLLGHLTDPNKQLSSLYGVVKNGGEMFLTVKGPSSQSYLHLKSTGSARASLFSENGILLVAIGGGIGSTAATTQEIIAGTTLRLQSAAGNFTLSTVGGNLFSLANPSAVTFLRVNADNTVTARTAAQMLTDLAAQGLVIAETVLTSGASIDIDSQNNTLATALSAITFTISNTSTFIYLTITLTGTALTLTFPANSLCVSEGTASGDNTCALSGVSGDVYEIAIKKRGATYSVISKNMGQ